MDREPTSRAVGTPKYRRIYRELAALVSPEGPYKPGDKLPSENELVERFGASRPTIGRALAQLENEGLVERRAGSGTYVTLRAERAGHVFGLLIPDLGVTEIFEPICQGISRARLGSYHDLLWGPVFDPAASKEVEAERLCAYFIKRKVSGVFFAPLELSEGMDQTNRRIVARLDAAGIPIILLDRDICEYPQRSRYDLVGINNHRAGYMVTEHLLQLGLKRILFFARPGSAPTVTARLLGFRAAMQSELGRGAVELTEYGDAGNPDAVRALIERCRPEGIVCANDETAARLMTTLYAIGTRVPAQVRITGVDDMKYAGMLQVPLTTIHQPCAEIGATALMAMLDRVQHPDAPAREFLVDCRLAVRASTYPRAGVESLEGVEAAR